MESITRTIWLKARQGDRASYDQLFALHAERALMFIRARLGPGLREKVEPQDVLQDAYLAAHEDFTTFEYTGDGAFLRWLCRIIENRIRDLGDYFAAGKRQPVELPRSDPTGPITALDRSEHRQKVSQALDRLSDDHRQVILLRYFEGLSADEATTIGTHRGRRPQADRPGACRTGEAPMTIDELVEAQLEGRTHAVPDELRDEFALAAAGHAAIQEALGETLVAADSTQSDRPPPTLPDDYELMSELGRGGMGVVYLVRQKSLNRLVAVKVLRPGEMAFGPLVRRFLEEARHLARLRHPNIVAVHEIGQADGEPYFTMDYVEGEPLSAMLARGPLTPSQAVGILQQAGAAVQYAHQQGIIHRDLKPGNILVAPDGRAFVSDFGLARDMAQNSKLTRSGDLLGTPAYMAPEQAQGQSELVGEASDVHAFGVILYEMLTGRPPYGSDSPAQVLVRLLREEPIGPRRIDRRIPRDLETICLKAMAKEPRVRYVTVSALIEDLRRFEAGQPLVARRPGLAYHSLRAARRYWPRLAAAAVAALALSFVAPRLFDKSLEDLIAWGDEEHASGRHEDALRVYRRALLKASKEQERDVLERIVRCASEVDDPKTAIEAARPILDRDPSASFGRYDYLVAQSLLTELNSRNSNWNWTNPREEDRSLMELLLSRMAMLLKSPHIDEAQQKTVAATHATLRDRLSGQPLKGSSEAWISPTELPLGPAVELLKVAADAKRGAWERGKAAFSAGKQLEALEDSVGAQASYREAWLLLRSTYPFYAGVRTGAPASTEPEHRRLDEPAPESRLLREVYEANKRLNPSAPEDLRGGLLLRFTGLSISPGVAIWPDIALWSEEVPATVRDANPVLAHTFAIQPDQSAWVGVADGRYRLEVRSFGISWQPADEDAARLLEIDFEALPKEVEIDGETIELSVAVRRATEVKLLSPANAASVDLNTEVLRWAAVEGAARYTVEVAFLTETGGMSFVAHLETTNNRLTLAEVDPRQRRTIRDELVAGRTGTWRVNAFDADGRRIGKTLDDGRFLVVKELEDDS